MANLVCEKTGFFCPEAPPPAHPPLQSFPPTPFPWEADPRLSKTDYLHIISIAPRNNPRVSTRAMCDPKAFTEIASCYPTDWPFSKKFVATSDALLINSPFKSAILEMGVDVSAKADMETDRHHFWDMLVATLPKAGLVVQSTADHPLQILDVGCGAGADAVPLRSYFSGMPYGLSSGLADYLGIDFDANEIEHAIAAHPEQSDIHFVVADATQYDRVPALQKKFDVVVIRHPEVFTRSEHATISPNWYKIFREAYAHLAVGGLLLMTAYRCNEFMGADEALTLLGAQKLVEAQNPFSARIRVLGGPDPDLDWRDHYVAVYTKLSVPSVSAVLPSAVHISSAMVSATDADEWPYTVTQSGNRYIQYHNVWSGHVQEIDLEKMGTIQQLASNGQDTFVYVADESHLPMIYRLNWVVGTLESVQLAESDYTLCRHGECSTAAMTVRGFETIEGQLLGKADLQWRSAQPPHMQLYLLQNTASSVSYDMKFVSE